MFAADVHRLEQGLEPQRYDAFLVFAEEDQDFAMEIVDKLENKFGHKVFIYAQRPVNRSLGILYTYLKNQNWNYLYFQVSPSSYSISCVRSCRIFVVLTTSAGLAGCRIFLCRPAWAVDRWSSNH